MSATGIKKPSLGTFPRMLHHLGQGRGTRGKRTRSVDSERTKQGGSEIPHGLWATRAIRQDC